MYTSTRLAGCGLAQWLAWERNNTPEGTLSYYGEICRKIMKAQGYLGLFFLPITAANLTDQHRQLYMIDGLTSTLGDFILSADKLPPRKNCISRGLERIYNHLQPAALTT